MIAVGQSKWMTWALGAVIALLLWATVPSREEVMRGLSAVTPVYRVDSVMIAPNPITGAPTVTEIREVLKAGDQWGDWTAAVVSKPFLDGGIARTVCAGNGRSPYNRDKGEWVVLPFDAYVGDAGCWERLLPGTYALIVNREFQQRHGEPWQAPRTVVTFTVPLEDAT